MSGGKFALRDYLLTTKERLSKESPSEEMLKTKIMPAVTNTVKAKSDGAPPAIRNGLKSAFFDSLVLPKYEADFNTFQKSIEDCLDVLRKAGIEGIPPRATLESVEEACEADADDVFAMMGGMGAEEGYKCSLMKEGAEAEEEAVEADADDVFAMMGGMGAEAEYKVTLLNDDEKPQEEENPAKKGREELISAIDGFLDKLDANPPNAQVLKTKAMPQIVNTVKAKSGAAPAELRQKLKGIFEENGVLPEFTADIQDLKQALIQIQAAVR